MNWIIVQKADIRARGIADRHYNRQSIRASQFTRPGYNLVLLLEDCSALWVSWRPAGQKRMDNAGDVYECTLFRNEGKMLSSELIRSAVELTEEVWGEPIDGWLTYINTKKVRSHNPGYCFLMAGWHRNGKSKRRGLLKLTK